MNDWVKELNVEVMVCDNLGTILEMNAEAESLFSVEGGSKLLGTNLLACHPEPSRTKLTGMLAGQTPNAYFNTEKGEKRFFFQSPWFEDGQYRGFVEISFPVEEHIPYFVRGK